MAQTTTKEKLDVYQVITDQILEALDSGVPAWRKPWQAAGVPMNGVSKKAYRGINALILALKPFNDNRWVTFKQAQDLGGTVRKGEKSSVVTFWKMNKAEVEDANGDIKTKAFPLLKYYRVFNVEQCDSLKIKPLDSSVNIHEPIEEAEALIAGMPNPPSIDNNGRDRAFYTPALDSISLPMKESFSTPHEYYSTAFHEMTHSTGHKSRLDRHMVEGEHQHFGDFNYGKEELVAEFGAAFLCGESGITMTIPNSAAYIENWRKAIKADKKLVVRAAGLAQRAADYILGYQVETD